MAKKASKAAPCATPSGAFSTLCLALLLALSLPAVASSKLLPGDLALSGPPAPTVLRTRERLASGSDKVAVDVFQPSEPGLYPAVIMLHGSHGPGRAERHYLDQAEDLARNGYVSLFVRYYERGRKGRGNRSAWAETIGDALSFATTIPSVDSDRLALIGYSQGAFLALNEAPLDPRIRAVVAYYGGLSPGYRAPAGQAMPPALLFHGTSDRIVPVRRSLDALSWLRENGRPADLVVYKGATHGFNLSSRGGNDARATEDAWKRTLSFLNFHLHYPSWTPAPLPLEGEPAQALFPQEPLATLPYLEPLPLDSDAAGFALINPAPSEVPVQSFKRRHHAKGGKGGKRHRSNTRPRSPRPRGR